MSALMQAIKGDVRALQEVLAAHHSVLLGYVTRHLPPQVRNVADPGDIVQDVCFEACRLIGKFKPDGKDSMFRWLVTIARNRMLDLLRIHAVRNDASADRTRDDPVTRALAELALYHRTPSRSAASHEFLAAVEQAMCRLPPVHRQVVTLRYIDGLSIADTAAEMDRTPDAVYWLCSRALEAIRLELESASFFI